ncbi:Glutathione hydrolase 1 proenzyme, partial [Anabarilius grahami]
VIAVVLLTLILILSLTLTTNETPSDVCYSKAAVRADAGNCSKGKVAADDRNCSKIGSDMLQSGGSAVDAAIAALLCLSVVHPHSMGIGGGVVFTIYNASTGTVEIINARETAPMNASENMFGEHPNKTKKEKPGLFIAVPGELRGYAMAHKKYGKLNWDELFQPSIKLAKDGFQIGKALARAINEENGTILNNEALCEVFCSSNRTTVLRENDTIKFLNLSETYEKIANGTADVFYNGPLAQTIVDDIKATGGIITHEDLQKYKPACNESALNFTVGNYIFHAPGAPFGGPVLALILNILKGYNLTNSSVSTIENKTLTYHRMIEAFRLANEQKSKLGDPHYENITEIVKKIVQNMTSERFADDIRKMIKDDTTKKDRYDVKSVCDGHGTSHVSVIAEDGSAVAVTSSINNYFGSGVMSRSTGIIFNDQMCDFSDPKSVLNEINRNNLIKPGKRPLSSKCPTIILDKQSRKVKMVVGGAGGTNITTSVAQVILNYLYFDYDLKKSVNESRVQVPRYETNIEDNFDKNVTCDLKKKNHTIGYKTELSVVQVVVQEEDKIFAESDPRNDRYPVG